MRSLKLKLERTRNGRVCKQKNRHEKKLKKFFYIFSEAKTRRYIAFLNKFLCSNDLLNVICSNFSMGVHCPAYHCLEVRAVNDLHCLAGTKKGKLLRSY